MTLDRRCKTCILVKTDSCKYPDFKSARDNYTCWQPIPKDKDKWQSLFNYMQKEHGVTLFQTDMQEIEKILFPPDYPYVVKDNDTSLEEDKPIQSKTSEKILKLAESLYPISTGASANQAIQQQRSAFIKGFEFAKEYWQEQHNSIDFENIKTKLSAIDDILRGYEDFLHGDNGENCTKSRKILSEINELLNKK